LSFVGVENWFQAWYKSLEFCEGNSVAEYATAVLWLYRLFFRHQ